MRGGNYALSDLDTDVLRVIISFTESPFGYFSLRRSCKRMNELMPGELRVSVETFRKAILGDNRFHKGLRLKGHPLSTEVLTVLDLLFQWEDRAYQWRLLVEDHPITNVLDLPLSQAEDVLNYSWCSDNVQMFRQACLAVSRSDPLSLPPLPEYYPAKALQMLKIYLEHFRPMDMFEYEPILCHMVRGGRVDCVDYLLNCVDACLSDFPDMRLDAAFGGSLDLVQRLHDEGVDADALFGDDLLEAIIGGNPKIVDFLLKKGAMVHAVADSDDFIGTDLEGRLALNVVGFIDPQFSHKKPNLEIAQMLIDHKCDVNMRDGAGESPLCTAAQFDWEDLCRLFIRNGARVNLMDAIHAQFNPKIAEMFVEAGARVDARDKEDEFEYPVIRAGADLNVNALKYLVEKGANLLVSGGDEFHTPLTAALTALDPKCCDTDHKQETVEYLLSVCPALATFATKQKQTPMYFVVKRGKQRAQPAMQRLLEKAGARKDATLGADALARLQMGKEQKRKMTVKDVKHYIKFGADVNAVHKGKSVIEQFVASGNLRVVEELLRLGAVPCSVAAAMQHCPRDALESMIDLLAKAGVNIDAPDATGKTPLVAAIAHKREPAVIETLLRKGASVTKVNEHGLTALAELLRIRHRDFEQVADLLLTHKASLDTQDVCGVTPLFRAVNESRWPVADWLMKNGADPTISCATGTAPRDLVGFTKRYGQEATSLVPRVVEAASVSVPLNASRLPEMYIEKYIKAGEAERLRAVITPTTRLPDLKWVWTACPRDAQAAVAQVLIDAGADVNFCTKRQPHNSPLTAAMVARCSEPVIRVLLDSGAAVDARNKYGHTAFAMALGRKVPDLDIAQLLLERGADVDSVAGTKKLTPLFRAVMLGKVSLVRWLLDQGANPSLADKFGTRPVDFLAATIRIVHGEFGEDYVPVKIPGGPQMKVSVKWMRAVLDLLQERSGLEPKQPQCDIEFAKQNGMRVTAKLLLGLQEAAASTRSG